MAETAARRDIPVLTYHSIDASGSPVSIAPAEFGRQMHALAAAGWRTLDPPAFIRGYRDGNWPARTFLLTFDDGYGNVLEHALPIAQECAFTATVFIATGRVGTTMSGPNEPSWIPSETLLDWTGLQAVVAAGWTIGSHTRTHRRLPVLSAGEASDELTSSKAEIEDRLGLAVTTLAYPYGAASPAVERLVAGRYEAAFGTRLAHATVGSRATHFERVDAYYLRALPIAQLDGSLFRLYLAVRRAGRALAAGSR